jgi:hypothetical protein
MTAETVNRVRHWAEPVGEPPGKEVTKAATV